jgi:plastocyanin
LLKKLLVIAVVSVLAGFTVLSVACGGDNGNGSPGGGSSLQVEMLDFDYQPATLSVRSGTSVTLEVENAGDQPHTFTIDGVVDSGVVNAGQSTRVIFTPASAGSLTFYCTVHGRGSMSGTLTVN